MFLHSSGSDCGLTTAFILSTVVRNSRDPLYLHCKLCMTLWGEPGD